MTTGCTTTATPSRIGIFGAGGFIGSHLVSHLLQNTDSTIEAIDLTFDKLAVKDDRLVETRGSVDEPGIINRVVERCDTVVSLTALCNPSLYNTRPLEVIDASYTDLVPLAERCTETGTWLLHFSTCEVYGRFALDIQGERRASMGEEETALFLGPVHLERWSYACAKQLLERRIWALGAHRGLPFTIIRPFNVIGPRMDFVPGIDGEGVPRVLACFMHALMTGADLPLVDGGERRRSFISIDDFVSAVARVLERPAGCQGEIINLGNPKNEVSIAELAAMIGRTYAAQVPSARSASFRTVTAKEFYGEGYDDSLERLPNIEKAKALLDWEPGQTLEEILPGIVDDYVARYARALDVAEAHG